MYGYGTKISTTNFEEPKLQNDVFLISKLILGQYNNYKSMYTTILPNASLKLCCTVYFSGDNNSPPSWQCSGH
jgi:hypothetical protein